MLISAGPTSNGKAKGVIAMLLMPASASTRSSTVCVNEEGEYLAAE
jgi:hypothetical protein